MHPDSIVLTCNNLQRTFSHSKFFNLPTCLRPEVPALSMSTHPENTSSSLIVVLIALLKPLSPLRIPPPCLLQQKRPKHHPLQTICPPHHTPYPILSLSVSSTHLASCLGCVLKALQEKSQTSLVPQAFLEALYIGDLTVA